MTMSKKLFVTLLAVAAMILVLLLTITGANAYMNGFTQFHDPEAPRVTDRAGILSDSYEKQAAERIAESGSLYDTDIVVLTVNGFSASEFGSDVVQFYKTQRGGYVGFDDYLSDYYDYNGYGLGDTFSGIILGVDMDPDERQYWFVTTGEAEGLFAGHISTMKTNIQPLLSAGRYEDAVDYFIDYATEVARAAASVKKYDFKNENYVSAENVYDDANMLTAADKTAINKAFPALREALGGDLVLVTVGNGFSALDFGEDAAAFYKARGSKYTIDDYAADYFNYHAFGKSLNGGARSGVIFALTKTESGYTAGCYSVGAASLEYLGIYSEQNLFLKDAKNPSECAEKLISYIDLVCMLNAHGASILGERADVKDDRPLLIDNAGLFTEDQAKKLTTKLEKAKKATGTELVVLTVDEYDISEFDLKRTIGFNHGLYGDYYSLSEYGRDYLVYNGYGSPSEKEAIVMVLYKNGSQKSYDFASRGQKSGSILAADNYETLSDEIYNRLDSIFGNGWYNASSTFAYYMRTRIILGHYPLAVGNVIFSLIFAAVVALIITLIRTSNSDNTNKMTPAKEYVDRSAVNIRGTNQVFVRSSVTRVYSPPSSSGGATGGGHHSSGSSGVHHGGGGGRF